MISCLCTCHGTNHTNIRPTRKHTKIYLSHRYNHKQHAHALVLSCLVYKYHFSRRTSCAQAPAISVSGDCPPSPARIYTNPVTCAIARPHLLAVTDSLSSSSLLFQLSALARLEVDRLELVLASSGPSYHSVRAAARTCLRSAGGQQRHARLEQPAGLSQRGVHHVDEAALGSATQPSCRAWSAARGDRSAFA